jgi:VanZ family protein
LPFAFIGPQSVLMTETEKREAAGVDTRGRMRSRLWRYGPLLLWMAFIFIASTALLSSSNTSRTLMLLIWLFPDISQETLRFVHLIVRKLAHLTEYAILGLLAARAFTTSSRQGLRRHWFLYSLLLVIVYALSDELHQSFVPSRTGSIYDSLIDIAGGLLALSLLALRRRAKKREEV